MNNPKAIIGIVKRIIRIILTIIAITAIIHLLAPTNDSNLYVGCALIRHHGTIMIPLGQYPGKQSRRGGYYLEISRGKPSKK